MGDAIRRLSEHFTLSELTRTSATHLDNTPPVDVVSSLAILAARVLEPIRAQFGPVYVASGYRSPAVNRFVHGSKTSQHMLGEAGDIIPVCVHRDGPDLFDIARWIARESGLEFDQLILEFITKDGRGGWLHVSHKATGENRNQILVATRSRGGTVKYRQILAREIPDAVEGS